MLNLSIWESVETLYEFTYAGRHAEVLQNRVEWFEQRDEPNYVLYWALAGEVPREEEVSRRLAHLRRLGPTPYAFNFEESYSMQDALAFEHRQG
jgi:hypothetical protein